MNNTIMKEIKKETIGYRLQKTITDEFITVSLSQNFPIDVVTSLDEVLDNLENEVSKLKMDQDKETDSGYLYKVKLEITKYKIEDMSETLFDIKREG